MNRVSYWREKLGVNIGMTRADALEKFLEWRSGKKTCLRCNETDLSPYCPLNLICQEAEKREETKNVGNIERDADRSRTPEINEPQTVRIEISASRKRAAIR